MVKQKELSNRNDKNKENNEPKKANIENKHDKKDFFDKYSDPRESEYSESFRQLQEELLNDNIEYIIDDKNKNENNTYRAENIDT